MIIHKDLEPPTLRLKWFHWGPSILVTIISVITMILLLKSRDQNWFYSNGLCEFEWYLVYTDVLCLGFIPLKIPYGPYQAEVTGVGSKLDVERCDIMGRGIGVLIYIIAGCSIGLIPNQLVAFFLYEKKYYKLVWLSQILSFAISLLILFLYLGAFIWSNQCPSSIHEYVEITGVFKDGPGYDNAITACIFHALGFIISLIMPCFIWVWFPQRPSQKDVNRKVRATLSLEEGRSVYQLESEFSNINKNDNDDTISETNTEDNSTQHRSTSPNRRKTSRSKSPHHNQKTTPISPYLKKQKSAKF